MTSPEIYAFATGYGDGPIRSASHVAWLLENAAVQRGWRTADVLGSESDLLEKFPASRDVIRGAIRIVEARGSMKMHRGCHGGLHLEIPRVESAAGALAIYLRSHGVSLQDFERTAAVIRRLLTASDAGQTINRLLEHTAGFLSDSTPLSAGSGNRAEVFTMRIIGRVASPLPEAGVRIGNEAELCDEFGLAHRTFRQALNILEDLEIMHVRRGRGGGYFLKPASPMGVIRRIYVMLASHHVSIPEANETLWKIATATLQMVFAPQRVLSAEQRRQWAEGTRLAMQDLREPRRWIHLQHAIDDLGGNRLTRALTSAMFAYVGRTEVPLFDHEPIADGLDAAEQGLIAAIRQGRATDAERHLHAGQKLLASLRET